MRDMVSGMRDSALGSRVLAYVAASMMFTGQAVDAAPPRPDLVVIMVDDMGFADLGCYGSEIQTPNLDRLAQQGIRATRFYTHGKCEPSRTALLTGAYAQQPAANAKGFDLAQTLKDAGYQTMMIGKNHAGPVEGFAVRTTLDSGATNYFNPGLRREGEAQPAGGPYNSVVPTAWTIDNKHYAPMEYRFPRDFYTTEFFSSTAVEYLRTRVTSEQRFFMYLAYNAPHWPLQALEEDRAKYKGRYDAGWEKIRAERFARQKELGFWPADAQLPEPTGEPTPWEKMSAEQRADYATRMEIYAAQIDRVDQGVGRVINQLQQMGRLDNTLFVFLSDNGADDHDFNKRMSPQSVIGEVDTWYAYGNQWVTVSNTPFRWHKRYMHNGGVAVPMIVSWPARMPEKLKGTIVSGTGHIMDIAPTLLEAAGVEVPTSAEGKSLLPLVETGVRTPQQGHSLIALSWTRNHALVRGDWKIACLGGAAWELYDLKNDPFEQRDLAAQEPQLVGEMVKIFAGWAEGRQRAPFAVQQFPSADAWPPRR